MIAFGAGCFFIGLGLGCAVMGLVLRSGHRTRR